MNPNIKFTDAACDYIKKMLEKQGGIGFRLSIKKTGCSGYSYLPAIINEINPNDYVFEIGEHIKIYVDKTWMDLLQNLQIDYVEEEKSGLKQNV